MALRKAINPMSFRRRMTDPDSYRDTYGEQMVDFSLTLEMTLIILRYVTN